MASQPMAIQNTFFPQMMTPTAAAAHQGVVVANSAFYGSPGVAFPGTADAQPAAQTAAGAAPMNFAGWQGAQAGVYSVTPAHLAGYYQPGGTYPAPSTPDREAALAAANASHAPITALSNLKSYPDNAGTAGHGSPPAVPEVPRQASATPPFMAPAIAAHQPILASPPQPIPPSEYWAQAVPVEASGTHAQPPAALAVHQAPAFSAVAVAPGQPAAQAVYHLDEREIKRQRRKQSNRESARRSRLRKQAECEDLSKKVFVLDSKNEEQKKLLEQLHALCEHYRAQNSSLEAQLNSKAANGGCVDAGYSAPPTPDMPGSGG